MCCFSFAAPTRGLHLTAASQSTWFRRLWWFRRHGKSQLDFRTRFFFRTFSPLCWIGYSLPTTHQHTHFATIAAASDRRRRRNRNQSGVWSFLPTICASCLLNLSLPGGNPRRNPRTGGTDGDTLRTRPNERNKLFFFSSPPILFFLAKLLLPGFCLGWTSSRHCNIEMSR